MFLEQAVTNKREKVLIYGGFSMVETNFSLLSQEEIDILIKFLKENCNVVESEVLSQESIDKLILMMKGYNKDKHIKSQHEASAVRTVANVITGDGVWKLDCEENESGFIELYATDGDKKEKITPNGYACACFTQDNSQWGYVVSPSLFLEVAKCYGLKFSKDVYQSVCERFALKNFGDATYDVSDFYLASGKDVISNLL